MTVLNTYALEEIKHCLAEGNYPVSGITPLGSAEFHILEPASYMGLALHSGSRVRSDLEEALKVSQGQRFREEDPYTDLFLHDFPIRVAALDSRFEYDLNWEIEKCIYPAGMKKWGLDIWKRPLNRDEIVTTHSKYREFHALIDILVGYILERYTAATVFDIHSFCYQREERVNWWEDNKPEINLGTRSINRDYFSPLIDIFLDGASKAQLDGRDLRIGENVLFPGGYLTRKYTSSYNRQLLVLAIEYKKIFMNERTGILFPRKLEILKENLLLTKDRIVRTKL
jgi:N-formylglutamate amidohydrolase